MIDDGEWVRSMTARWREVIAACLERVGCTHAELAQMAKDDAFATDEHRELWELMTNPGQVQIR